MRREGTRPNSFYKGSITAIPKLDKDKTKKNYKTISLMNIDAKILCNIIQQHIEKIMLETPRWWLEVGSRK
jgi:hypothetical protein